MIRTQNFYLTKTFIGSSLMFILMFINIGMWKYLLSSAPSLILILYICVISEQDWQDSMWQSEKMLFHPLRWCSAVFGDIRLTRKVDACLRVSILKIILFIFPRCVSGYAGFGIIACPQAPCQCDNSKTNENNFFMILCRSLDICIHKDDPYFKVTFCDHSCLTERSRKVKFWAFI